MIKKKISNSLRGKKSRAAGRRFEAKVRADLEEKGWIIDKWTNTINYDKDKIVPAKRKYNPYLRALSIGNGFPDFICFKNLKKGYEIIGVEVKRNGYLDKKEKEMCRWYLDKKIFPKILIAKPIREGRKIKIEYNDFEEKYGKKYNKI